jgi:hypothetical protein
MCEFFETASWFVINVALLALLMISCYKVVRHEWTGVDAPPSERSPDSGRRADR